VKFTEFQYLSSRGFGKIRKISNYRTLWLHLSKLAQDFGNATGLTYGGQTLLHFAISVLVIYGFMLELPESFNYILFSFGLLFQVIIYLQCNCAHGAANEVRTCLLIPTCLFPDEIIFCRMSIYLSHTI
jgi:gustatory receptor